MRDASPISKKKDQTFVQNFRLVSVLPTVSKIFEIIMQKQISHYIRKISLLLYVDIVKVLVHNMLYNHQQKDGNFV